MIFFLISVQLRCICTSHFQGVPLHCRAHKVNLILCYTQLFTYSHPNIHPCFLFHQLIYTQSLITITRKPFSTDSSLSPWGGGGNFVWTESQIKFLKLFLCIYFDILLLTFSGRVGLSPSETWMRLTQIP